MIKKLWNKLFGLPPIIQAPPPKINVVTCSKVSDNRLYVVTPPKEGQVGGIDRVIKNPQLYGVIYDS